MHHAFPDGDQVLLKPGQAALITGGSFYQLENAGSEPMIMGNRSGAAEKIQIISHETRKDIRRQVKADFKYLRGLRLGRGRCHAFPP